MFRVPCPSCRSDNKALTPQPVSCEKCGHKFKPQIANMFFKVRCGHCQKVAEQPAKNIGKHGACPHCAESSLINSPPPYQKYLDQIAAKKQDERDRRKASSAKRKEKRKGRGKGGGIPKRGGASRKREAVRKAVSQPKDDEILHECGFCGAGISELNIEREEAVEYEGSWFCWDHTPDQQE